VQQQQQQQHQQQQQEQQQQHHNEVGTLSALQVDEVIYAQGQAENQYQFQAPSGLMMHQEGALQEQQPLHSTYQDRGAAPPPYSSCKQQQQQDSEQEDQQLSTYEQFLKLSAQEYDVADSESAALNLSSMGGTKDEMEDVVVPDDDQPEEFGLLRQVNVAAAMAVVVASEVGGGHEDRET
ncbi:hypothetical protein KR009_009323, partial [Drosophila setifemur]